MLERITTEGQTPIVTRGTGLIGLTADDLGTARLRSTKTVPTLKKILLSLHHLIPVVTAGRRLDLWRLCGDSIKKRTISVSARIIARRNMETVISDIKI